MNCKSFLGTALSIALTSGVSLKPALAGADQKPMTMSCDISYVKAKSMNDPIGPGEELPVNARLQPSADARTRYYAEVSQITSDGRYKITADAVQPLKGDVLSLKMVRIHIEDLLLKVAIEESYPAVLAPRKDVLDATQMITWNLDKNHPDQPWNQLNVVCRLR